MRVLAGAPAWRGTIDEEPAAVSAGEQKGRLGRAIATVRKRRGLTQREVETLSGIPQVTLSRWENDAQPSLDDLARLEDALSVSRGAILREAGYIENDPRTVAEVIDSDPTLDDRVRALVWSTYREAQSLSSRLPPSATSPPVRGNAKWDDHGDTPVLGSGSVA